MKYADVLKIIKDFENSQLTSLELEIEDIKVKMTKNNYANQDTLPSPVQTPTQAITPVSQEPEKAKGYSVLSPLVGTYYNAASPEAQPFVRVGERVKKGDTLCIIEAMKIMNEITAPVSGEILSIHAKSGAVVGYNQLLIVIDDAK